MVRVLYSRASEAAGNHNMDVTEDGRMFAVESKSYINVG